MAALYAKVAKGRTVDKFQGLVQRRRNARMGAIVLDFHQTWEYVDWHR